MRKVLFLLLTLIVFFGCFSAPETVNDFLKRAKEPVVVIGTGSAFFDCTVKLKDGNNEYFSGIDNSLCSAKVGDVLK